MLTDYVLYADTMFTNVSKTKFPWDNKSYPFDPICCIIPDAAANYYVSMMSWDAAVTRGDNEHIHLMHL